MKYAIVLLIVLSSFVYSQDIKLSNVKVQTRLKDIEKALLDRQKKVLADDPECQRLEYLYRGLAMAYDSTLSVTDSTLTKRLTGK